MSFRNNFRPLVALAASFSAAMVVVACGGSGSAPSPASEAALRAARPGELVAHFKARIGQRTKMAPPILASVTGAAVDVAASTSASFSGTNLQEAGVDEDDLLKTDGRFMYAMHPGYGYGAELVPARLEARRIQPDGSLGLVRDVVLDGQTYPTGMYLLDDAARIAVMGMKSGSQTSLDIFALSDDAAPAPATQLQIDGNLVSSRRIGNVLYLATTSSPDLSRYWLPYDTPAAQVEEKLAGLTATELLPGFA